MNVIPAIDLYEGQVVRLKQGDFEKKTIYCLDPTELINQYEEAGFTDLHIVDLSGAQKGEIMQEKLLMNACRKRNIKIQFGGGIRKLEEIESLFSKGVDRVVIGSLVAEKPELIKEWVNRFGVDRIVLAIDVRIKNGKPIVMTQGWNKETSLSLYTLVDFFYQFDLKVLCTDISRDGLLAGPNLKLYESLVKNYSKVNWTASGGVKNRDDLYALYKVGVNNVVVGKSLYEKHLTLEDCKEVRSW